MEQKGWRGHFFEDFTLGQVMECPTPRAISWGDVSNYIAFTGDRTPRFCDARGEVHPLVTFHSVLAQTVRYVSLNARANLGYAGMRWLTPVHVNDTLSVQVTITGLKENSSQTSGIVYVDNIATNQRGESVMTFSRWVMVRKRDKAPTPYLEKPTIPTLPSMIEVSELKPPPTMPSTQHTGGRWAFEDYQVGERVLHFDGMTVNHSDHMSFTRLFQNSAKVHFDALLTEGRPLVYGGLPISIGYAMAFNGFERRLGLCGLNGGTHANPLHSGDTIYAFSDILETVPLSDPQLGALRVRLVCTKNENPAERADPMDFAIQSDDPKRPHKKRYNPNVILDLDFWEVVPTRAAL